MNKGFYWKKISLESVFHADSHGIFLYFENNNFPPLSHFKVEFSPYFKTDPTPFLVGGP
jgi:hypothetical protein